MSSVLCDRCGQRPATRKDSGAGGWHLNYCDQCHADVAPTRTLFEQLWAMFDGLCKSLFRHSRKVDELEARIAELERRFAATTER